MRLGSGQGGRLLVGYQLAARLGRWSVDMLDGEPVGAWEATAQLAERNAYWLEHGQRFDLELQLGRFRWRFRDVQISVGKQLTARGVDKPEVSGG